jgi:two-component system NtrC family sensor kinase
MAEPTKAELFARIAELEAQLDAAKRTASDALEQQTATSEILRVISSSPTDVQPAFQAVIENAVRLCGAVFGRVFRRDGQRVSLVAHKNFPDEAADFPRPLDDETLGGRAARTGRLIRTADVETDPSIPATGLAAFRARHVRSVLVVPISHNGETLGSIVVGHADIAAFSDVHVAMLQKETLCPIGALAQHRALRRVRRRYRKPQRFVQQGAPGWPR